MPASEESLMRSSCKAAGDPHVSCRSLASVIPLMAICVPGLHLSTTTSRCEMCVQRWAHFSLLSEKLKAILHCFSEVHQKELHPNKMMFCLLLLFTCFLRSLALSRLKWASFSFCFFLQACKRSLQASNSWQFI